MMKKQTLLWISILCTTIIYSQTPTENYRKTTTYQKEVSVSNQNTVLQEDKIETITYYDGLGRPKQNIVLQAGQNKEDIITHMEYGPYGNQSKNYLPYAITSDGSFRANALQETNTFYNTTKYENTLNPYSQSVFEASPANRVLEQAAPGASWIFDSANVDTVTQTYERENQYNDYNCSGFISDFLGHGQGGGGYNVDINEGVLTVSFNGSWSSSVLLTNIPIHTINTAPFEPFEVELGQLNDGNGPVPYTARISTNGTTSYLEILAIGNPIEVGALNSSFTVNMPSPGNTVYSYNQRQSKNNTIRITYETNIDPTSKVLKFGIDHNTAPPTLVSLGHYKEHQLHKTITYDENWQPSMQRDHSMEEFKDKEGRVVLKRTYNSNEPHDTYYVYDYYGNLTHVIPPKVDLTDGISSSELAELCYQYHYDAKNRLIEKKIPGKGWEHIVYNKLDQPIMTQDANQRLKNEWSFTLYDPFGRLAYTGLDTNNDQDRSELQNLANLAQKQFVQKTENPNIYAGVMVFYTKDAFPSSFDEIYTISYYDNYNFNNHGLDAPGVVFEKQVNPDAKGLSTATKTRVLETNQWIVTVIYYDHKNRPIYTASKNEYLNTTDIVKNKLDFVGNIVKTRSRHQKDDHTEIVTVDTYVYDHMNRLKYHKQCIGDDSLSDLCGGGTIPNTITLNSPETQGKEIIATSSIELQEGFEFIATNNTSFSANIITNPSSNWDIELITDNLYDELGQLIRKNVGNSQSHPLQNVDYTYNVRGWLQGINTIGSVNTGDDLFTMRINYDTPANFETINLYNGNISETSWKTIMDESSSLYRYEYDALNRITNATDNQNRYSLRTVEYDKNGNIKHLIRKGAQNPEATAFGDIDMLYYTYDTGNKLLRVSDIYRIDAGFDDGNTSGNDFDYDDNGNMIEDKNKGITNITYNHLNLPQDVIVNNTEHTGNINYIYDAAGAKLKKTVTVGSSVTTTEYAGNYVYKNGSLEFFNHPEGYIEPSTLLDGTVNYKYTYQYKDHLGNIRLAYSDLDNDWKVDVVRGGYDLDGDLDQAHEIKEIKNYYPFGLQHKGYNSTVSGRKHNYGYNGKEEQNELGLGTLDYGARFYDPAVGRWFTPDALAEKYYSTSPYSYALNNPIIYIDPDGNQVEMCCETLQGFVAGMVDNTFGTNLRSRGNTQAFRNGISTANGTSMAVATILMADGALNVGVGTAGLTASGTATLATAGAAAPVTAVTGTASGILVAKGAAELAVGGVMMANTINNMKADANAESNSSSSGNSSGESSVSKEIHDGKQGKHVEGHNNYQQGKSTITEDPQSLLDDFHNGGVESSSAINDTKTRVNFGKKIGNYINPETGEATSTTNGIIHNSKKGAHIVPSRPN